MEAFRFQMKNGSLADVGLIDLEDFLIQHGFEVEVVDDEAGTPTCLINTEMAEKPQKPNDSTNDHTT